MRTIGIGTGRSEPVARPAPWRGPAHAALVLVLLLGCATPFDPFLVPEDEVRARVQTIALAPFQVHPDVGDRAVLAPLVESAVLARFEGSGYRVLPAATMASIWRRIAADVGPVFDPKTGAPDEERWALTLDLVSRELRSEHGVDAILRIDIERIDLELARRSVGFCGADRDAYWPEDGFGFFDTATLVQAGCLRARLYDLERRQLFGIRHALETYATYLHQTRAVKPVDQRFTDPVLLHEAIEGTIGSLAGSRGGR